METNCFITLSQDIFKLKLQKLGGGKKHDLCFDFSNLIRHGKSYRYEREGWEDTLQYFKTVPYTTYHKDRVCYRESRLDQLVSITLIALERKLTGKCENLDKKQYNLSKKGIFYCIRGEDGDVTDIDNYDFATNRKKLFIRGVGETSSYCNVIRGDLLKELQPKEDLLTKNKEMFRQISRTNSVCVSIRRGDYFNNPALGEFAVCTKDYFYKAVKQIKLYLDNPIFFVFSDDMKWCRDNIYFEGSDVRFELDGNPVWEKLRLMSACKHFIISNSTFSWWAQWLGTYPNKIVVSPKQWYTTHNSSLVEEHFIKIGH